MKDPWRNADSVIAFDDLEAPGESGWMRTRLIIGILVLLSPRAALAYRPFDSTDASVAAPGEVELELGPVGYVGSASRHFLVAPGAILNLGVFRHWEVVLQGRHFDLVDGPQDEPRFRLVDTGLFLKGVLREGSLQRGTGPSVPTEIGPLLTTVNGDPSVGATAIEIVSQRWDAATLHVNGAVSYTRAHKADLFGGEGPHGWTVRPVVEGFVEREFDTTFIASGLIGAIWRVKDGLSFDAVVRVARVNDGGLSKPGSA